MQIIKVRFLKNGTPSGMAYTYFSNEVVAVGDLVKVNEQAKGIVAEIDVPEDVIKDFREKVKFIYGKIEEELPFEDKGEVNE